MNTCKQYLQKAVIPVVSAGLLFVSLFTAEALINQSHAATSEEMALKNGTQVAYFWGNWPYSRGYYQRHYWSGWHPAAPGCSQRCLHNRWTGAVARCERVCR